MRGKIVSGIGLSADFSVFTIGKKLVEDTQWI